MLSAPCNAFSSLVLQELKDNKAKREVLNLLLLRPERNISHLYLSAAFLNSFRRFYDATEKFA